MAKICATDVFDLGDCDYTDNDGDALKMGRNSYLKSNRDKLHIQEKLRRSQVDDKV